MKNISRRSRYELRPIRIWDGIQWHRSHNVQIVHYRIVCLLRRAHSRGKVSVFGGPPQSIVNSKPPTPFSDSIICARDRVLHAAPASTWYSNHHQRPTPGPLPMDRTRKFLAAGTMPKKSIPQRIPIGRPPTYPVQPLPQYRILAPSPPIPGMETHGRLGWLRSTPPRKTWRNKKHAGDPHQQDQTIPQSTLLFYMWIWCRSPRQLMPSFQLYISYAQHPAGQGTYVWNQGSSVVAQHKSILYGTGDGMGLIFSNSISKAQFVMQRQQEFTKLHQQQ